MFVQRFEDVKYRELLLLRIIEIPIVLIFIHTHLQWLVFIGIQ